MENSRKDDGKIAEMTWKIFGKILEKYGKNTQKSWKNQGKLWKIMEKS